MCFMVSVGLTGRSRSRFNVVVYRIVEGYPSYTYDRRTRSGNLPRCFTPRRLRSAPVSTDRVRLMYPVAVNERIHPQKHTKAGFVTVKAIRTRCSRAHGSEDAAAASPFPTVDALNERSRVVLPAEADTDRASQLFQHLLKKPGFSWERDGEAQMEAIELKVRTAKTGNLLPEALIQLDGFLSRCGLDDGYLLILDRRPVAPSPSGRRSSLGSPRRSPHRAGRLPFCSHSGPTRKPVSPARGHCWMMLAPISTTSLPGRSKQRFRTTR